MGKDLPGQVATSDGQMLEGEHHTVRYRGWDAHGSHYCCLWLSPERVAANGGGPAAWLDPFGSIRGESRHS